ncbi:MAG: hypothetical protein L0241_06485 [Planctomycetia bacterium]|nr:hypothetical protein [Planctomycetia bacterium]
MDFNLKRVAEYIRAAQTEELLDRVTVYRAGMEEAALDLMEGELDRRGISREQIAEHDAKRRETVLILPDGTAKRCSFCDRPAIKQLWRWHKLRLRLPFAILFGRKEASLGIGIPLFPYPFAYCSAHDPEKPKGPDESTPGA